MELKKDKDALKQNIDNLIDSFIREHNIDIDKIHIMQSAKENQIGFKRQEHNKSNIKIEIDL